MNFKSLHPRHPIAKALKRAKNISKDLRQEFGKFLAEFEDWESQAMYLLEDKGEPIEKIVEDLFDVPAKDQAEWKKAKTPTSFEEDPDLAIPPPPEPGQTSKYGGYQDYPQFSFKNWKQEHGFD